jgi:hypothetical protein
VALNLKTTTRDQIASFKRSLDFSLAASHNLGRQALPYLKLFWASLEEATGQEKRNGIDFIARRPDGRVQCAVCCRTFANGKPAFADLESIRDMANTLEESGLRSETFLLVHNADGGNLEFRDRTTAALSVLAGARVARVAEVWNRQALIGKALQKAMGLLDGAFRKNAAELLYRQQCVFRFGRVYVPKVPLTSSAPAPRRFGRSPTGSGVSKGTHDISTALRAKAHSPWTILTGADGAGKTAAVLNAARSEERVVIVIPAALVAGFEARHNVSKCLEDFVRSLEVFGAFADVYDQEILYRLAGPALAEALAGEKSPYLLVLDGIDEDRPAAGRDRVRQWMEHVASLGCPVILTTADASPFRLADMLRECAGAKEPPRLLSLEPWTSRKMIELASQALREASGEERQRLAELLVVLQTDRFVSVYRNVPRYPLFLHMILEEVAEAGVRPASKSELLNSWVQRRMRRAFPAPGDAAAAARLLEDIAGRMINGSMGSFELSETAPSDSVNTLALRRLPAPGNLTPLLQNSLLVSQPAGRTANFDVGFSFETLQAYFTAHYLIREKLPPAGYPVHVQGLYQELTAAGE